MRGGLSDLIHSIRGLSALVIGDAMLDRYTRGTVNRLCPEAPVPVVALGEQCDYPGGAANVALNARALGAKTTLLSVIGNDAEGANLCRMLASQGISTEAVRMSHSRRTMLKHRIAADSHLLIRLDQGTGTPLDTETESALAADIADLMPRFDVVILSDYGYGILTPCVVEEIRRQRGGFAGVLAADSKDLRRLAHLAPTVVKPNYRQAVETLGVHQQPGASRRDSIAQHSQRILEQTRADMAAVTLDEDGAMVCRHGHAPYVTFCRTTSRCFPSGAGDAFLSAFSLALGAGGAASTAAEIASAVAAVVVQKEYTATCSPSELKQYLFGAGRTAADLSELVGMLAEQRRRGRRIVLTCGCFDILHRGHITYLQQAKSLGDLLVVGINSDASIGRLKGAGRPINSLEDRVGVLAGISCVDYLVAFEQDTPHRLIASVRPDVFVKGGDYTRERLPEASLVEELGGRVEILPFIASRSTTGIIERIRQSSPTDTADQQART